MTMSERIIIHASHKKKGFLVIGLAVFSLLALLSHSEGHRNFSKDTEPLRNLRPRS